MSWWLIYNSHNPGREGADGCKTRGTPGVSVDRVAWSCLGADTSFCGGRLPLLPGTLKYDHGAWIPSEVSDWTLPGGLLPPKSLAEVGLFPNINGTGFCARAREAFREECRSVRPTTLNLRKRQPGKVPRITSTSEGPSGRSTTLHICSQ